MNHGRQALLLQSCGKFIRLSAKNYQNSDSIW